MQRPFLVLAGLAAASLSPAWAVNKCMVNGHPVYQDQPCVLDPQALTAERARNQAFYRKLDALADQGEGRAAPPPRAAAADPSDPSADDGQSSPFVGSKAAYRQHLAQQRAEQSRRTQARNAESAAALTRIINEMEAACPGGVADNPGIGMTDETFRNCTRHARFGGLIQVVNSREGGVPLRLYVFSTPPFRVYSVNGVVTEIRQ